MNLLTVKNLSVQIEQKTIIEDLRTVLLKALLKLVPYAGEIIWDPKVRIGYVPQKIDADVHLPLTFNDLFAAKCQTLRMSSKEIDQVSASVGLTRDIMETPVGHVSGGQFQRGLIGFALLGGPNVLLLDEPTASIDEPGEEHIYELIHRLQDQYGLASIMVSHDLSFVFRYATKVLCLNRRSLCLGTPREVLAPEVLTKLYGEPYSFYQHDHSITSKSAEQ